MFDGRGESEVGEQGGCLLGKSGFAFHPGRGPAQRGGESGDDAEAAAPLEEGARRGFDLGEGLIDEGVVRTDKGLRQFAGVAACLNPPVGFAEKAGDAVGEGAFVPAIPNFSEAVRQGARVQGTP